MLYSNIDFNKVIFMKVIVLFLLLLTTLNTYSQSNKGKGMFLVSKSKYSFNETFEKISKSITDNSWKVITSHNLQEIMKKNGKDVHPVQVIETCNPNHAYKVLSKDDERLISNMLPCRISIYENSDGSVYVSRINPEAMQGQVSEYASEVVGAALGDIEKIIENALK